jgi:hypothetical protein
MNVIASPGGSFPGRGDLSPRETHATLTEAIMTYFFLVKTVFSPPLSLDIHFSTWLNSSIASVEGKLSLRYHIIQDGEK